MTSKRDEKAGSQSDTKQDATRWLGVGGAVALLLAALAALLAWQHAADERHASEDVKARVAAEMSRIEAEAQRIEREASK